MASARGVSEAPADRRRGYGAIFARGEFRWLWLADVQSLLDDQLARVALTVLVYERTSSGLASAAVYAATFVPALGPAAFFSARSLTGCHAARCSSPGTQSGRFWSR